MNQIEQMIQKLKEDTAFAGRIAALTTREAVVEEARRSGIELSVGDIDAVNDAMQQELIRSIDQTMPAGKFLHLLLTDQKFAQEVMAQTEVEEVISLAKSQGIDLTEQDIAEVNKTLLALSGRTSAAPQNGELSEEDLEQVAGGFQVTHLIGSMLVTAYESASFVTNVITYTVMTLFEKVTWL